MCVTTFSNLLQYYLMYWGRYRAQSIVCNMEQQTLNCGIRQRVIFQNITHFLAQQSRLSEQYIEVYGLQGELLRDNLFTLTAAVMDNDSFIL